MIPVPQAINFVIYPPLHAWAITPVAETLATVIGDHIAFQSPSLLMRNLPVHGEPPTIWIFHPTTAFEIVLKVPPTSSPYTGFVFPIPTNDPLWNIIELVIPEPYGINLVIYPPLPYAAYTPVAYTLEAIAGSAQNASHEESEVRILPIPGVPPVILICPATSKRAFGDVVPIPTLQPV